MRITALLALAVLAMPLPAQGKVGSIESAVFVERSTGQVLSVEPAQRFRKGERVVTVMRWKGSSAGQTVTSPVPQGLQFERASEDVLVSTDGGRTWHNFAAVQPESITHLRWRIGRAAGRLSYSAIVR